MDLGRRESRSDQKQRVTLVVARPTARSRLIAAAQMRLPVGAAVWRALPLIQLRKLRRTLLIAVVFNLARFRRLFVAGVFCVGHGEFFDKV